MASKRINPAAELAEKLLAVLEAQRGLGTEAYPLTLKRLAELADPLASPELIDKAVGKKPLKDRVVTAQKKNLAAPIALMEDLEQLAASPLLLDFALAQVCTPEKPTTAVAALKAKVDARLKQPLEAAVNRQIEENSLPPTVEVVTVKKARHLHPKHLPLPKLPGQVLAENLLHVLEAQRQLGPGAYPPLLSRLIELTDPGAKGPLIKKALAHPTLQGKITLVGLPDVKKPIVLLGDRDELLSRGWLLEFLLGAKRQSNEHAFAVDALLPKKADLFQPLLDTVNRQIETDALPPTLGWMWIDGKKRIFLMEDIHHGHPLGAPPAPTHALTSPPTHTPAPASTQAPPPAFQPSLAPAPAPLHSPPHEAPADFALVFDEAFNQFNRRNGGHNFVSLVEMRKALPMPADDFNAELRKLRVADRYTLSGAEGRHGLSPEESAAGIVEDGSLLLYVSRKAP